MPQQIIDFWFAPETRKLWFNSTPEFDQELKDRFETLWQQACRGELDDWMETPEGCLALVIILDQLPLNMFRNTAQCFSSEAQSRVVATHAIEHDFDQSLPLEQVAFLYMPYMHSEDLGDQDRALDLFNKPGMESSLRFAHHHRDIVERFGRFPHRNELLGRASSAAEIEYLGSKEAFTG